MRAFGLAGLGSKDVGADAGAGAGIEGGGGGGATGTGINRGSGDEDKGETGAPLAMGATGIAWAGTT